MQNPWVQATAEGIPPAPSQSASLRLMDAALPSPDTARKTPPSNGTERAAPRLKDLLRILSIDQVLMKYYHKGGIFS